MPASQAFQGNRVAVRWRPGNHSQALRQDFIHTGTASIESKDTGRNADESYHLCAYVKDAQPLPLHRGVQCGGTVISLVLQHHFQAEGIHDAQQSFDRDAAGVRLQYGVPFLADAAR
jgi:hypothetical protein